MDVENGTYRCIIYNIVFIYYRHYKITRTMTNKKCNNICTLHLQYSNTVCCSNINIEKLPKKITKKNRTQ